MSERGPCFECGEALTPVDDDPNGARNAICARCTAEQEHDFDAEPNVVFSRSGNRVEPKPAQHSMPDNLRAILQTIPKQPQRQDSTADQLSDLRVIANHLGLYDAADAIKSLTQASTR